MRNIILTILTLITFYTYAQDFSTINFIGRGSIDNTYAIYINQHLIGSVKGMELLQYKMYSEGLMSVMIEWNNKRMKESMNIKHGKTYYFESFGAQDREVGAMKGKALLKENKSTITGEEDKANPLTKTAEPVTDLTKEGTCFVVGRSGYLITAYHIVSKSKDIYIKGIENDFTTLYKAEVVSFDADLDLALLKIKNANVLFDSIPYRLSSETIQQGAKSLVVGYPLTPDNREMIKATEGTISAKSGYKGSTSQYTFSGTIELGNSGSPLFNDKGDVTGLINAKLENEKWTGYAVKSPYIQAFLTSAENLSSDMNSSTTANLLLADKIAKLKNYIFIVNVK